MPAKDGFQLTDDDLQILRWVFDLRLAHIGHLAAVTGRSEKALSRRLLKLQERRYLACLTRRPQKHVYAIGAEAVPALIEHGHAPAEIAGRRLRHRELTEISIRHSLFVVDVHVKLIALTRAGPVTLVNWQEGPRLWDSVAVRDDQGREVALPVRPDAWFTLQHADRPEGRNRLHVFLEADRSTMSHARMAQKITGYVNWFQQGKHARKYPGMRSFQVATVTEGRSRAAALRTDLGRLISAGTRRAYPFVALEDLTLEVLLPPAPSA
jgi:hypothetical protein